MIHRTVEQLATMLKIENDVTKYKEHTIQGIAFDTRMIKAGNLFIPLKGEKADGHQYVDNAIAKGAGAVLWQKDMPYPPEDIPVLVVEDTLVALQELAHAYRKQLPVKVLGITGSNGKTTTKDIAAAVFSQKYRVHKTDGNFNNHIGLPYTLLHMAEDTEIAILEMGMSSKGEISLLSKIAEPDVAIITNIGEAHLQDLGSREAISEAKFEIVDGLAENGLLIIPGEEPLLQEKVSIVQGIRTQTFGETSINDVYPEKIHLDEKGNEFTLKGKEFFLPISGKHNVMNALAVISAAKEFTISDDAIKAGLKKVKISNMRMEWHKGIKGTKILNDAYNASPTSMRAVLSMFVTIGDQHNRIVVLGDMLELGEQEKDYHLEIGMELSPETIKYVFTYGKLGKYIAEGAREHFPKDRVFDFMEKNELIKTLTEKIEGNEYILFKASRGAKLEEMIETIEK
ncbi:UDP-N-acetylmuramoyl-tripeptide--D-alanyl-D-alanine ligase [Lederbergia galactosidilytica]|uniref:UDP-N-acetylmuramoyl-tripeptide--D-alanyl-D-alanine ligase n=1 Tax=Lederbergia galactosidilytica TaxID=217031 RepID=A0A178A9F0_9BACI|nr:UDP-N-acetylmuramoyl-tripeptide--D-alanyl-D-alanine ligase [Lederbergia galactosidilytica]KRG16205.1 UDP-N-acetylmuramoyl-tripeptide--D-alanyl-D-alanine ligase [Virgibacillus soli]MBP1914085.1 UDP-N-acetylmuramoyl-tripeptide--D-alanyl-D-alanine ligase [Lederbergia galactosidilytica]OAK75638.1 UDP-N-acetylmuramoyl-tripeptide--D-alanyl-D-alanine ligase [Lederbergia galactosidilytica]